MKINKDLLVKHIEDGLVSVQKHPDADLFIYNYTQRVQYERLWDEVTLITRGLILDGQMNVVAKPFGKFFNLDEHTDSDIPSLPFDVFDKLDGSLGILYWVDNVPFIATRGSFTSEQAIHATSVLHRFYWNVFDYIDRNSTYLFEIIYPENRIVVDYGDTDDLFLITIIDNNTGEERIENLGFPCVKRFDYKNIRELKSLGFDNKEGFVIRFSNGFRVKVKFDEYVRLHRIVTQVSTKTIWEHLSSGKPLDELLERVPDEFFDWVKSVETELTRKFNEILDDSKKCFAVFETRKQTAEYFKKQKHQKILFSMLDNRDPSEQIWKMIKPQYSKPFKNQD